MLKASPERDRRKSVESKPEGRISRQPGEKCGLAAEIIHGEPTSFRDPARFSFAHGGKDGHPYPVDRAVYDRTVEMLGSTLSRARMSHTERTKALKRLTSWARGV